MFTVFFSAETTKKKVKIGIIIIFLLVFDVTHEKRNTVRDSWENFTVPFRALVVER